MSITFRYVEEPEDAMYCFRRHGYSWTAPNGEWGWLLWLPFFLTLTITGGRDGL